MATPHSLLKLKWKSWNKSARCTETFLAGTDTTWEGQARIFCCVQQELKATPLSPPLESSSHSTHVKLLPDLSNHLFPALKQQ